MPSKTLFLICNAHLDPVWLWTWPEGLAETLATFRTAAELCGEFEEFIFCHNEALLYRWVEEYDPVLFDRIRGLVREGRWRIMGGWYVQPDCNLPGGESFVRQAVSGKLWFLEKFGVEPRTAVNLDPFGHSRGLVQILKKSGFDSYLFCRPDPASLDLPGEDFIWVGYDGSEIAAHRAPGHYNSGMGQARVKVEDWLSSHSRQKNGMLLWGIGDHGGGPSREDLMDLRRLSSSCPDRVIRHAGPEDYFDARAAEKRQRPRVSRDLNPWAVGVYTSMARIKRRHRSLESRFLSAEKIASHAAAVNGPEYPGRELEDVLDDLLFCQFHDILPGSSIAEVESQALRRMDHGLEILDRIHTRAFFALAGGQAPAAPGEYPILVYNPHPYPIIETVVCEFQPPEPGPDRTAWRRPVLTGEHGASVPHQAEKESANIMVDQRKRVVLRPELPPGRMSRFSCRLMSSPGPWAPARSLESPLRVRSESAEIEIDNRSGRISLYRTGGVDFLRPGAARLLVVRDDADPWGMKVRGFRDVEEEFRLMTGAESARFAGVGHPALSPLRVIEDGPVRTVVEALLTGGSSQAALRYFLPRIGAELGIELRIYWNEKDRMLKLSLPTPFRDGTGFGQSAYGVEKFEPGGEERTAQKWAAVVSGDGRAAMTVINDGPHGLDFVDGELRLSLLRSPGYAAHPVADEASLLRPDRFEPRIDQGERIFRFWIQGGEEEDRMARIEREAQVKHEPPTVLCMNPAGGGARPVPLVLLEGEAVVMTVCKRSVDGNHLILRLFNPTGKKRAARLSLPSADVRRTLDFEPFEILTLRVDPEDGRVEETDLLERPLRGAED